MTWAASVHVYTVSATDPPNPFEYSEHSTQALANLAVTGFWTRLNTAKALGNFLESDSPPDAGRYYVASKNVDRVITYVLEI